MLSKDYFISIGKLFREYRTREIVEYTTNYYKDKISEYPNLLQEYSRLVKPYMKDFGHLKEDYFTPDNDEEELNLGYAGLVRFDLVCDIAVLELQYPVYSRGINWFIAWCQLDIMTALEKLVEDIWPAYEDEKASLLLPDFLKDNIHKQNISHLLNHLTITFHTPIIEHLKIIKEQYPDRLANEKEKLRKLSFSLFDKVNALYFYASQEEIKALGEYLEKIPLVLSDAGFPLEAYELLQTYNEEYRFPHYWSIATNIALTTKDRDLLVEAIKMCQQHLGHRNRISVVVPHLINYLTKLKERFVDLPEYLLNDEIKEFVNGCENLTGNDDPNKLQGLLGKFIYIEKNHRLGFEDVIEEAISIKNKNERHLFSEYSYDNQKFESNIDLLQAILYDVILKEEKALIERAPFPISKEDANEALQRKLGYVIYEKIEQFDNQSFDDINIKFPGVGKIKKMGKVTSYLQTAEWVYQNNKRLLENEQKGTTDQEESDYPVDFTFMVALYFKAFEILLAKKVGSISEGITPLRFKDYKVVGRESYKIGDIIYYTKQQLGSYYHFIWNYKSTYYSDYDFTKDPMKEEQDRDNLCKEINSWTQNERNALLHKSQLKDYGRVDEIREKTLDLIKLTIMYLKD